jgi:hypothetical protein
MVIVSLTSIPPRFDHLKDTIESLQKQSVSPKIFLSIPKQYRRTDFRDQRLPKIVSSVELLRPEEDFGPATKLLPVLEALKERPDQSIVYCDDDRIYDSRWLEELVSAGEERSSCCITSLGKRVENIDARYAYKKSFVRKALRRLFPTSAIAPWCPPREMGFVDVSLGYSGVLVRPRFFTNRVFNIPDLIWPVDDIWLSGNLAVNKVKVFSLGSDEKAGIGLTERVSALSRLTYRGLHRAAADKFAVEYFRREFGVWKY